MLDERGNLLPDDLQCFGMKILTQKFALFGFLEVEGKKKCEYRLLGFVRKNYSMTKLTRELTHAA